MSISDKTAENVDYSQIFRNCPFRSKFAKYLDLGQNFRKISSLVNIHDNLDLDKNYENLDFGQNCLKILILVNIFGKSRF